MVAVGRDPILLCDIIYAVCKPQAEEREPPVTDEEFGRFLAEVGEAVSLKQNTR